MSARCPVCPKADTTGRFMSTRPSLMSFADLGRSARQAPLHRLRAAGIGAAGDDAEVGAGLLQRRRIHVGFRGGCLDGGHRLEATCERVLEKLLRALAAFGFVEADKDTTFRKSGLATVHMHRRCQEKVILR